jgi:hypothetical protein
VAEAQLLLELFVISLDAPPELGKLDQSPEPGLKGPDPVVSGFVFPVGPFDQELLDRS